jgi:hypothetical protein
VLYLKLSLPFDPAILFLACTLEEKNIQGAQESCTRMFITAISVIAKQSGSTLVFIDIKIDNSVCSHHDVMTSSKNA